VNQFDEYEIYCRKLGHHLSFEYCRKENTSLPCAAIARCWSERLPIENYLQKHFNNEDIAYLSEEKQPKTVSIWQIMNSIKERQGNADI